MGLGQGLMGEMLLLEGWSRRMANPGICPGWEVEDGPPKDVTVLISTTYEYMANAMWAAGGIKVANQLALRMVSWFMQVGLINHKSFKWERGQPKSPSPRVVIQQRLNWSCP